MVKVKSCLSLCPIPDPKNFLGLKEDNVPESLIVTLGRNLVLRTKTTDLQQLTSWNIRDHLSSPVSYDKYDNRYIGIFNSSCIKFWSDSEENYEKAKKYKFSSKLHSVLTQCDAESIVVFSNGFVQNFSSAIHARKQVVSSVIQPEEYIVDTHLCGTNNAALIATNQAKNAYKIYFVTTSAPNESVHFDLKNKELELITHCFISSEVGSSLVTFWSDGNICSSRLGLHANAELPGTTVMNIKSIKTTQPIAMKSINANLLVLYGCDPSEEGALLLVVDTRLRAVVCRHYFKMYTKPPQLWVFHRNIVLSMGQYLALVPFQMTSQLLDTRIKTQIPEETKTKTIYWESRLNEEAVAYETYEDKFGNVMGSEENIDHLLKTLDSCAEVPDSVLLSSIKLFLNNSTATATELLLKVFSFSPPKSAKLKNTINFEMAVELLTRILNSDIVLFNAFTCEWTTCIIDAYYHRFLLSEDEMSKALLQELLTVSQLEVHALLQLSETKLKLERRLEQLGHTNRINDVSFSSKTYTFEIVKLY